MENVFRTPNVFAFKEIGDVSVIPETDTSPVHVRRMLYYRSIDNVPHKHSVDIEGNAELDIGREARSFASSLGYVWMFSVQSKDKDKRIIMITLVLDEGMKQGEILKHIHLSMYFFVVLSYLRTCV